MDMTTPIKVTGNGGSPGPDRNFTVVVIGGGAAGITVTAQLLRHRPELSVAVVEPSETHSYQPGWTLVGAGVFTRRQTERREETLMPKAAKWLKQDAKSFDPGRNRVELADGSFVGYQYLVVCPGLQLDWKKIDGLTDALGKNGVCSNYVAAQAEYTWECMQAFRSGTALFTQPPMPIKCAGAPQKIMYLAADHFRKNGRLAGSAVEFCLAGDVLFGVPTFVPPLQKAVDGYGIKVNYRHTLKAVDGPARKAVFSVTAPDGAVSELVRSFDMMHVTPPQSAPDFIKASPLANAAGWIEVDPATLRHTRFANVFGLGDAAGTTNAKTAAAVRLQAPVVVKGLLASIDGKTSDAAYDGYGSCPLITSYGKVVLAEFIYGGKVTPSFPLDPRVPRTSAWLLKTKFLPVHVLEPHAAGQRVRHQAQGTAAGRRLVSTTLGRMRSTSRVRPDVIGFYDPATFSIQYIVVDPASGLCAVVDPILDFDPKSGGTSTQSADRLLRHIEANGLKLAWILDTHPHADHFSAAGYLKDVTGARTGIGERVTEVQKLWKGIYNLPDSFPTDGSQWDRLFADGESFMLGDTQVSVMLSPGHTLCSVTYVAGDAAFIHDTLFMPDSGSARADFPGGDARTLWRSIQSILALPDDTRLFTGHDYRPGGRDAMWESTVLTQKRENTHVRDYDEAEFVELRTGRDRTLPMPKLILSALQVNISGGRLPAPEAGGKRYLKIPLNAFPSSPWD